jgi:hypothetical protein
VLILPGLVQELLIAIQLSGAGPGPGRHARVGAEDSGLRQLVRRHGLHPGGGRLRRVAAAYPLAEIRTAGAILWLVGAVLCLWPLW